MVDSTKTKKNQMCVIVCMVKFSVRIRGLFGLLLHGIVL